MAESGLPTFDSELYLMATSRAGRQVESQVKNALDTDGLSCWIAEQLQHAYREGLRDGYVQGRHDEHREPGEERKR